MGPPSFVVRRGGQTQLWHDLATFYLRRAGCVSGAPSGQTWDRLGVSTRVHFVRSAPRPPLGRAQPSAQRFPEAGFWPEKRKNKTEIENEPACALARLLILFILWFFWYFVFDGGLPLVTHFVIDCSIEAAL